MLPSKVAIVTEDQIGLGGADKLLQSVLKIFPNATIFTTQYKKEKTIPLSNDVKVSFLNHWLFNPPLIHPLKPLAFETLDVRGYDIVISMNAQMAHGVIATEDQVHIDLVLTPSRMIWDREFNVRGRMGAFLFRLFEPVVTHYQRIWDITASERIDHFVSISEYIAKKVWKRYRKESAVIHPGIPEQWFEKQDENERREVLKKYQIKGEYFLAVSRLWDYKRVDVAIEACGKSNKQLVIVGDGPDRKYLEKIAGKYRDIKFLGYIPEDDLKALYSEAEAFLFCGVEDFGYVAVESMSVGTPVISINKGGALDTVVEGETGLFYDTEKELETILRDFKKNDFSKEGIISHSRNFTEKKFINSFKKYIERIWQEEKT